MKFFKSKLTVVIILLSVLFVGVIGVSLKKDGKIQLKDGALETLSNVQGVLQNVNETLGNFVDSIVGFSDVKNENTEEKKENSSLSENAIDYNALQSENNRLQAMLNFESQNPSYNYIASHVIRSGNESDADGYIIDKGSNEGIKKGMPVITPEGLVGQVVFTSEHWSKFLTISDENISVAAMIKGAGEEGMGMVKGNKDGSNDAMTEMTYLPIDSKVKQGDVVTTSNVGFIYPKGIKIGQVTSVEEDKAKIMKVAEIKPYVDFNELQEVLIIVPKDGSTLQYKGEEIK